MCQGSKNFTCPITGQCAANALECIDVDTGCTGNLPYRCPYTGACTVDNSTCYNSFALVNQMQIGNSSNLCSSVGKIPCLTQNIIACVTTLSDCVLVDSGCPATMPIKCNGACVASSASCSSPSSSVQPALSNACPATTPFRCSRTVVSDCQVLPYSSYSSLYSKTCSVRSQKLIGSWTFNRCMSEVSPYSCADGSCSLNMTCQTCPYYC